MDMDLQSFVREVQNKYEKKLIEREMEVIAYWKEQLDRLAVMKPEGVASLQTHIRKLSEMMANRITTLKKK
ncbi:MAG: hypothetical protein U1C55_12485 [Smithellaceae bacterium]|nr:hypothetical protein [Smithellaceae bacterium]